VTTIRIRPELREAIARAILDDAATGNGEHLYDGERLLYYCPMQAPELAAPGAGPRVPVRELLPPGLRIPTFADFLANAPPGEEAAASRPGRRQELSAAYEAYALAWLCARLPAAVRIVGGA
jgi:hypothetical protein